MCLRQPDAAGSVADPLRWQCPESAPDTWSSCVNEANCLNPQHRYAQVLSANYIRWRGDYRGAVSSNGPWLTFTLLQQQS